MTIGGHHSPVSETDVWLTPPEIIRALGTFDFDPCAAPEPRPWPTAAHHVVKAEDGLSINSRAPLMPVGLPAFLLT